MQTNFTDQQRLQTHVQEAESILRSCVHCGFCIATCPTYLLLGDELDSPRGRIYLIKDMLESDRTPTTSVVRHVDRCLSCLGCVTTCPSGVNYMHLVDQARTYIETRHRRPMIDRILRSLLVFLLPHPGRLSVAFAAARAVRPLKRIMPGRLRAMVEATPRRSKSDTTEVDLKETISGKSQGPRVALSLGCVQQIAGANINRAAERVLRRLGCEVIVAEGSECCGALAHHLGKTSTALDSVKSNVLAWTREFEQGGLDAIVIAASGCGTMVKDYGYLLSEDPEWSEAAKRVSGLAQDITQTIYSLEFQAPSNPRQLRVAYQDACSLAHGQQIREEPRNLLRAAGYDVVEVPDGHLCCGSAGTYNVLQSDLAGQLGARKADKLESVSPDVIAVGNIGCIHQISSRTKIPVVHTIELLDWASGGPQPQAMGSEIL